MVLHAIAIPPLPESPLSDPSRYLLIGLHGWGANAQDLASLAPYMNLPDFQMLFPDAPFPHPYAPGGKMWYGFPMNFDFRSHWDFANQADLLESRKRLREWLQSLEGLTGIPLSRTILAGFSQGGAMTLDIGLGLPLAGLIIMSGYLHAPVSGVVKPQAPPVFMVHGRQDPVVPVIAAHQARDMLQAQGIAVQYHEFDMGHEIQPSALAQIRSFVQEVQKGTVEKT